MGRDHTHGVLCRPCVYLVKNEGQRSCQKGCCPFCVLYKGASVAVAGGCLVVVGKGSPMSHLL